VVHRLHDLRDVSHALHRQVDSLLHHADDRGELPKLIRFRRSQWIRFEERNDGLPQLHRVVHDVNEKVFPVIVSPAIAVDLSAPEVVLDRLKNMGASLSLHNREAWLELPTESDLSVPLNRTAEAAFTVDEADDPLLDPWPFLLIARTRRIVTAHVATVPTATDTIGTAGCSGFPAYSQLHSYRRRHEGQSGVGLLPRTLGPFLTLHVAMGLDHIFTTLHDSSRVRRMASEDSVCEADGLSC
jgi:hypothetical protein